MNHVACDLQTADSCCIHTERSTFLIYLFIYFVIYLFILSMVTIHVVIVKLRRQCKLEQCTMRGSGQQID